MEVEVVLSTSRTSLVFNKTWVAYHINESEKQKSAKEWVPYPADFRTDRTFIIFIKMCCNQD